MLMSTAARDADSGAAMNRDAHPHKVLSDYREFPAPLPLAAHFLCFWTQSIVGSQSEYAHRVLPDGCIDIVFINDDPPVVVGPWTDAFVVRFAAGTRIVGARLHPGRAPSLLGVPAAELLNRFVPLSAVWSMKDERFAGVSDERSLAGRRSVLAEALLGALTSVAPFDQAVVASIRWLARHPHGRVEQLSRWVGISSRQMQRRFAAAVGYGPKMFQSVLRFQRLLNIAGGTGTRRPSLAELAADAGYADQAHMTREVQRFSNCPPTALLYSAECTLRMSDLFKTNDPSPNYL
jgi:AraC-like DNA-binding protein